MHICILCDRTMGMQRLKMRYLYASNKDSQCQPDMDWSSPVANKICMRTTATRKEARKKRKENIVFFKCRVYFFNISSHTLTTRAKDGHKYKIFSLRKTCVVLHRKHFQIEYLKWSLVYLYIFFFFFVAKCIRC